MGRQNIFNTLSVASVVPMTSLHDLTDFLVANRTNILPLQKKSEAFKTRFSGNTFISEIVHRLSAAGKDQAYSLIRVPAKTTALREVVDMTFIPIDLLQIKAAANQSFSKTLSLIPELNDKLVINITDITKANGEFSDVTQFQWRVVRDFLSRSFFTSTGNVWITPALVRYVAKVYSMTIGGRIAALFGLSPLIQMYIQTCFLMYFVQAMTTLDVTQDFIKSNARNLGVIDPKELDQIFAFVTDTLGKKAPTTLEDVFEVIDAFGHDQLKNEKGLPRLNRPILNMRFASLFPEGHVSSIALEYPPYYFFLILLVLSGTRIGLSHWMKTFNLDKEGRELMTALITSPQFINKN